MKPEQQRIAIAEACYWTRLRLAVRGAGAPERFPSPWGFAPGKNYEAPVTAYERDLNAMHEAEKVLTAEQARTYDKELQKIGFRRRLAGAFWLWHFTADWKAEAFLRTIGKWEDDK